MRGSDSDFKNKFMQMFTPAAFHRQFVGIGLLGTQWGRLYDQLFEDRQERDYGVFISFEPEYVQSQLTECSGFLAELQRLASSISQVFISSFFS
jgi:uncharacterized protein (UPF0332 family)